MSADLQYSTRAAGAMLVEPHKAIEAVHFPTEAVVVLIHKMEDGSTSNAAVVGNEGIVGVTGFMSEEPSPVGAVVQIAGGVISMRVNVLRFHFARGGKFQRLLLSYTQRLIEQISQTAACRRQHRITQHVASWLLMIHDRAASRELLITQDHLADRPDVSGTCEGTFGSSTGLSSNASPASATARDEHGSASNEPTWLIATCSNLMSELETEKNLPGASCELPEAAATKKLPEIKFFRRLVEFRSGRSSSS